jgi:hypothetical protein
MTPLAWPGVVPLSPAIAPSTQLTNDAGQSLLLNVVNQFSIMQQQMLDQFQQTTFMMLQMFSAMQKDQFELIRQELDALRELNREIHELQTELAKHPAKPAGAPPSPEIAPSTKRRAGAASTNFAAQMPSPAVSAAPANQAGAANGARFVRKPVLVEPAAIDPAPKTNHVPKSTADAPATKEPASSGGPAAQGEDVHGWLSQRFNDLQKERQSRWQKIVGTLMGK